MRRTIALVAALLLALTACGVTTQKDPEPLEKDNVLSPLLDPDLTTTTIQPAAGDTKPFPLYFVRRTDNDTRLVKTEREVDETAGATQILALLLEAEATKTESDARLVTAIPEGTKLASAPRLNKKRGLLVIDLSSEITQIAGEGLRDALAQIVFTATELADVQRVRFRIEGKDLEATTGNLETTSDAVSRADYNQLRPT